MGYFSKNRYLEKTGFTLLEVLLGISIISIVLMSIYQVFSGGIFLSRRVLREHHLSQEALRVFERMALVLDESLFV